jgi:uncharacterized Zn finger protein
MHLSIPMGPCKHAVAAILVYLDAGQNQRNTPVVKADDERLAALAESAEEQDDEEITNEDDDDESVASDDSPGTPSREDTAVRKHLEGLSKSELVNLILEGRNVIPELRQQLSDRAELQEGNIAKMIASTRREIEKVSREPGWINHWKGESHIPDYSRVKQRLENLLAAGQADDVESPWAHI